MTRHPTFASFLRRVLVVLAHLLLWVFAYGAAFMLRFDGAVPSDYYRPGLYALAALLALRSSVFWFSGLFHGMLRYAGVPEVASIVRATAVSTVVLVGLGVLFPGLRVPRSIYAGDWVLAILAASSLRLAVRMARERRPMTLRSDVRPALLVGAGDAGEMFLRDLERDASAKFTVVGVLDDDPVKRGSFVRRIRVIGPPDEMTLRRASEDLDARLAVLAMPSAPGSRMREIVSACTRLGIETKTVPSLHQIVNDEVRVSMLRDVAIEDLLRREPVHLDDASLASLLRGKRLLISGAAGSIGSELVRQAARYEPACLGILDHNENGIFHLERQLRAQFPRLSLSPLIGDIKDQRRVANAFRSVRPHVVLHAAAHKHVPLMEANPAEAIKNNVFGTRVVADLAKAYGTDTFVMISTDKAVNPTSIMGTSKRIAEMYVQSLSGSARTKFVAVRFGNVLGSEGSVVPLFREQIAAGGPVCVTHPEMRRYFMTIPEAAQLVLQAGALAKGGEIFVLDMGDPVKIVDLARDMIRMSGLEPDVDVPIVFTGMRPGEKLFEELLHASEGYQKTVHSKIMVGRIRQVTAQEMRHVLDALVHVLDSSPEEIRRAMSQIVPEATLGGMPSSAHEQIARALNDLTEIETLPVPEAVGEA